MLESIERSEEALSKLASRSDVELGNNIRTILQDDFFWNHLKKLLLILKPINEAIRMSESTSHDLSKVIKQWLSIYTHLVDCERFKQFEADLHEYTSRFHPRMAKQVSDVHRATFYLDPAHHKHQMAPPIQRRVNELIRHHCVDADTAIEEFNSFRSKAGIFYEAECWEYTNDTKSFWKMQVSLRPISIASTKKFPASSIRIFIILIRLRPSTSEYYSEFGSFRTVFLNTESTAHITTE
jgi:hypothetical protein